MDVRASIDQHLDLVEWHRARRKGHRLQDVRAGLRAPIEEHLDRAASPRRTAAVSAAVRSLGSASFNSSSKQAVQPRRSAMPSVSGVLAAPRSSSSCSRETSRAATANANAPRPSASRAEGLLPRREGASRRHSNHADRPQSAGRSGPRRSGRSRRRRTRSTAGLSRRPRRHTSARFRRHRSAHSDWRPVPTEPERRRHRRRALRT